MAGATGQAAGPACRPLALPTAQRGQPTARRNRSAARRTHPTARRAHPTARRDRPIGRRYQPTARRDRSTGRRYQPTARRTRPTARSDDPAAASSAGKTPLAASRPRFSCKNPNTGPGPGSDGRPPVWGASAGPGRLFGSFSQIGPKSRLWTLDAGVWPGRWSAAAATRWGTARACSASVGPVHEGGRALRRSTMMQVWFEAALAAPARRSPGLSPSTMASTKGGAS